MITSILQTDSIDALRQILENEQSRSVEFDEAVLIGEYLVSFYQILSDNQLDNEVNTFDEVKQVDYDR